ncbi:MAG: NAD(+)/NADH kinase [Alphaproteobacteria bacterium]
MTAKFFLCADETNKKAVAAAHTLAKRYASAITSLPRADVIVPLGGDGLALRAMRLALKHGKKVFGMNLGHVGAYQNAYAAEALDTRLEQAVEVPISPLVVCARSCQGKLIWQIAFNEVYVRSGNNPQQARLLGSVSGWDRSFYSIGDGHLIATPIGSYAYNLSAGGQKLALKEHLLASTSIAASYGVADILPAYARVHLSVMDAAKRSVSLCADNLYLGRINECDVYQDTDQRVCLLWDAAKYQEFDQKGQAVIAARSDGMRQALKTQGYYHCQYERS